MSEYDSTVISEPVPEPVIKTPEPTPNLSASSISASKISAISLPLFQTDMTVPDDTRIITLSDIHGDLDALIIALRDCAKVIDMYVPIEEMKAIANLNLNVQANTEYFKSHKNLGFNWIGGTTHVVIIGDIIDPKRSTSTHTDNVTNKLAIDVYPQVEIKILEFLNKLDEFACMQGGRVIKLIGNHEIINMMKDNNLSFIQSYSIDPNAKLVYPSGKRYIRANYFNMNNPGFKIFMERGSGVLLKINNNIFVHGQLSGQSLAEITRINTWLNHKDEEGNVDLTNEEYTNFINLRGEWAKLLWGREYGDDEEIDARSNDNKEFCNKFKTDLKSLLPEVSDQDLSQYKLIIGHCPQNWSTTYNTRNTSYNSKTIDGNRIILEPPSISGLPDLTNNFMFGITMECDKSVDSDDIPANTRHSIYKVDIGTSRGFDQAAMYHPQNKHLIKPFFGSRVPQVLEIINNNTKIIKSTFTNTRMFQHRPQLEALINTYPEVKDSLQFGGYKHKYMKYKLKYLKLKNNIVI
jgi:hypothetical protein